MALKEKNRESNFFTWLSTELNPEDLAGVINSYRTVNAMLLQKKALTKPIMDIQDPNAIETVQKNIKSYIGGKQLRYQAARILSLYLNYLQRETSQKEAEDKTESIESHWIELTDANYQQFERTRPAYCEVGGQTYDGQNWARVLTALANHEINSGNPRIQNLFVKPLLSDRKNRPFFMTEKIEGLNCSQLENEYWINVNYSIPRLMKIIYSFCICCGYEDGQIKIYGIPKDKSGAIASSIQNGRKRISREGKDSLGHFYNYLITEKDLSERTAKSYCTSIRKIELYIQEHSLDLSVKEATSENIQYVIDALMARQDFVEINDRRHHQFGAAMAQYAAYLGCVLHTEKSCRSSMASVQIPEENQESIDIKNIEDVVLKADLNGIPVEELASEVGIPVLRAKKTVQKTSSIINVCGRLLHKGAFIDWDDIAEKLDSILEKLMLRNNGYVSDVQLYEYARLEMQMLLNDNDMDDQRKVYDLAEHLFSKECYKGTRYVFSNKTHISQTEESLSSKLDIMQKFAREEDGFFRESDLEAYLQSLGIKTASLRQQMRVYDEPIFLFYDQGTYITSESIGINSNWLAKVKIAVGKLFDDVGDHIVLRDIQPEWFAMLPKLPAERQWTALLLQSVVYHYAKEIGARTIYGLATQTKDTLNAMLVSIDSEIQTFGDAVITVLIEERIDQRQFEAEELRRLLAYRGLIAGNELIWNMPKALPRDERFIWDADEQHVTINI